MRCITNCSISLLFIRKFNCARKLCFKYIYPTDTKDKTKVACVVCQQTFDTIERSFMASHQWECSIKVRSSSVNKSQAPGPPSAAKTIASSSQRAASHKRPDNNHTVSTTLPIDLNQLQFDKFKFMLAGNTLLCNYGIKCRLCKEVFRMDEMELLQHRYVSLKREAFVLETY